MIVLSNWFREGDKRLEGVLRELRKRMLRISALGKDGNLQSCFSSLEVLWALYDGFLPVSINGMESMDRNRFVLSKGQANLALMVVLAEKGLINYTELESFCKFGSRIAMQADRTKFDSFVEISAGSLGHGFPMAVGMAWAKKIKGNQGRVFCLTGDAEMNEGTMWEAALFASSEALNNLVVIIDNNHSVYSMIEMGDLARKLESFGFYVCSVNGHNVFELKECFQQKTTRPFAVLAETIRGWGSKSMMNDRSWFHRYPRGDELEMLIKEVDAF